MEASMNVAVTQGAEGFGRRAFTVRDVQRMLLAGVLEEGEKFELIEGEIVPMSPKGNQREVVKSALNRIIPTHAPHDLRLGIESSVYLSMTTFVEPDLCLYPKRILPEDVRGPDLLLVIEVAGSSLGYDKGLKGRLYAAHGVCELWVIDATRRVAWIHKKPNFNGSWGTIDEFAADQPLMTEVLPGLAITLSALD
jgi:Uma2 family endonuclease